MHEKIICEQFLSKVFYLRFDVTHMHTVGT